MIAANLLLIKPSPSIFLKSERVKLYFNKKLRENIKCALNRNKIGFERLEQGRGRMFLYSKQLEQAHHILHTVFGIHSIALAFAFQASSLEEIRQEVTGFCGGRLEKGTFAVRAVRSGEQDFTSQEIERSVGAAILKEFPGLKVDLKNPDTTVSVEVRGEKGTCYVEELAGFSGLPQGVEGAVGMFFEGRKEELACAWLLMKRGCNIFPIGKQSKPVQGILSMLEPWNCYRRFSLSQKKDLAALIEERKILALASADTGTSKKDFLKYKEADSKLALPVLRPLLFFDEKKLAALTKTISSLK